MWQQWIWEDWSQIDALAPYDNRSAIDWYFLPYPRTFADFDDAERRGYFVPRLWESIFMMVLCAALLTVARWVFDR